MALNSIGFIFCFLPLILVIFYSVPKANIRDMVLLVSSLIFYFFGCSEYLYIYVLVMFITVFLGRLSLKVSSKKLKKIIVLSGIIINVSLLIIYKVNGSKTGIIPLGISFYTFKAVSYLLDIYNENIKLSNTVFHDFTYLSFFAHIHSGPITRYNDMSHTFNGGWKNIDKDKFADGVCRFLVGFNKKIIIADSLVKISNEIFSKEISDLTAPAAWLGSICFSLQLLFDFSGYSDMAIGISKMFGFNCRENFNYPYATDSISHFWRRWHITLGEWFRDYIYIPLGGSRNEKKYRVYINLLIVWTLTSFWHGISWNFIIWGLIYCLLISFERLVNIPNRLKNQKFKIFYRLICLLIVNFEWVIFKANNVSKAFGFIKCMFIGANNTLLNNRCVFLLKEYWIVLLSAVIMCIPFNDIDLIKKNEKITNKINTAKMILMALLFCVSLSFVVSGQNNPFLYANF